MYESQFDPAAANDPSVKTESNRSEWQPMPAGALFDLQSRLRLRASRRRFIQAASVAGVFATIVGVGYWTRANLIAGRGQN